MGIGPEWNSDPVDTRFGSIENLRTVFVIFNLFCNWWMLKKLKCKHKYHILLCIIVLAFLSKITKNKVIDVALNHVKAQLVWESQVNYCLEIFRIHPSLWIKWGIPKVSEMTSRYHHNHIHTPQSYQPSAIMLKFQYVSIASRPKSSWCSKGWWSKKRPKSPWCRIKYVK